MRNDPAPTTAVSGVLWVDGESSPPPPVWTVQLGTTGDRFGAGLRRGQIMEELDRLLARYGGLVSMIAAGRPRTQFLSDESSNRGTMATTIHSIFLSSRSLSAPTG